jgi:hypothetical protein
MSKSRGLGRGFDSLIPTELAIDAPVAPSNQDLVHMIPPSQIDPNPHQPRKTFNEAELEGLAASIRQHGVLQPLVVSQKEGGRYELIAGERRLRASKLANQEVVPVIIRSFGEQQKLELALTDLDRPPVGAPNRGGGAVAAAAGGEPRGPTQRRASGGGAGQWRGTAAGPNPRATFESRGECSTHG